MGKVAGRIGLLALAIVGGIMAAGCAEGQSQQTGNACPSSVPTSTVCTPGAKTTPAATSLKIQLSSLDPVGQAVIRASEGQYNQLSPIDKSFADGAWGNFTTIAKNPNGVDLDNFPTPENNPATTNPALHARLTGLPTQYRVNAEGTLEGKIDGKWDPWGYYRINGLKGNAFVNGNFPIERVEGTYFHELIYGGKIQAIGADGKPKTDVIGRPVYNLLFLAPKVTQGTMQQMRDGGAYYLIVDERSINSVGGYSTSLGYTGMDTSRGVANALFNQVGNAMFVGFEEGTGNDPNTLLYNWDEHGRKGSPPPCVGQIDKDGNPVFSGGGDQVLTSPDRLLFKF